MIPRPAPDPMGQAANDAMISVSGLDVLLAVASSPNVTRAVRAAAATTAFAKYRQVVRAFTALEAAATNAAAAGYERDDRAMDIKENAA